MIQKYSSKRVITSIVCIAFFFFVFTVTFTGGANTRYSTDEFSQEEPQDERYFARTAVNVTLTETHTTYFRRTEVPNPQIPAAFVIRRYSAISSLTTHGDILVQIRIEFNQDAPEWNNSYDQFVNSSLYAEYKTNLLALNYIIPLNASVLNVKSSSFESFQDNITQTFRVFTIEQFIIFEETSIFLLSLPEPFLFERNKLELSQITDFSFRQEFVNDEQEEPFAEEEVRIKAPGSALEYVTATKGYSGSIYLGEFPWDLFSVPHYEGLLGRLPQDIELSIELPSGQEASYTFDTVFKNEANTENVEAIKSGNTLKFHFSHDGYLPYYVEITSFTPLLAQFSIGEYISMGAGILAGLFTLLKGVPFYIHRRSFGKFKGSLHSAASSGDVQKFEQLQDKAVEDYMAGKMSAREVEEIRREVNYLRKFQQRKSEEESDISIEEFFGE